MTRSKILFYTGRGASVRPLLDALKREIDGARSPIRLVSANQLADGEVLRDARLLVMPGGEDKYYCQDLMGEGEGNICASVHDGMGYLGICAAGYYGAARIRYHYGEPDGVTASRLGLVPVTAIGSIPDFAPAYDKTLDSAAVVRLQTRDHASAINSYYHGGSYFEVDPGAQVSALARYADIPGKPAAIVSSEFGRGLAILMGAHIELSAGDLSHHLHARRDGDRYKHLVDPLLRTDHLRLDLFRNILGRFDTALRPVEKIRPSYEAAAFTIGQSFGERPAATPSFYPG